jgi:hypothetical protein
MDTEIEVDLLCVGSGDGALAAAIAAAKSTLSVYFTERSLRWLPSPNPNHPNAQPWPDELTARFGVDILDQATTSYLEALTEDLGIWEVAAPVRQLAPAAVRRSVPPAGSAHTGFVPPFYGSALRTWARECLQSTNSVLSTRVALPGMVNAQSNSGERIELADIAVLPTDGLAESALHCWLLARARACGVQTDAGGTLHRLLFENDEVVGAVILEPTGPRFVRTRYGVILGIGVPPMGPTSEQHSRKLPGGMKVCLVSRYASRFSRLELIPDREAEEALQSPKTSRSTKHRRRTRETAGPRRSIGSA